MQQTRLEGVRHMFYLCSWTEFPRNSSFTVRTSMTLAEFLLVSSPLFLYNKSHTDAIHRARESFCADRRHH